MADAMIGHEDHERLVEQAFVRQPPDHPADMGVGEPHRIEVGRPVGQEHAVAGQVGGQGHRRRIGRGTERGRGLAWQPFQPPLAVAELAAGQLHLHEEVLAGFPARPIFAVVDGGVPLEVVVGLAERLRPVARVLGGAWQPVTDAGVPAGFLEDGGHRPHAGGQFDRELAAAAAVMMGPDRGLVHPRDHRRATRGADRRRHEGMGESRSLGGQAIDVRGGHRRGAVAAEVGRHVVDHDPQDVGPVAGRSRRRDGDRDEPEQHEHDATHDRTFEGFRSRQQAISQGYPASSGRLRSDSGRALGITCHSPSPHVLPDLRGASTRRVKSRTCPTGRAVRMRRAEAAKGTAAGTMTVTGPHSRSGCATNRFLLPPIPRLP